MQNLIQKLIDFRDARGWKKFHTEAELARSYMTEAAELNRLYQWGHIPEDEPLKEEIADGFIYLLYKCEKRGFDPRQIILEKIEKNAIKYPAHGSPEELKWNAQE